MTNPINVVLSYIQQLSTQQTTTAGELDKAAKTPTGISQQVQTTHGTACQQFNTALSQFEQLRLTAGMGIEGIANKLGLNLSTAAQNYATVDQSSGQQLGLVGNQMQQI
jgi:hypothetical protein